MKTIHTTTAMKAWSRHVREKNLVIGFVPTMGALHNGHRSLIRAARLCCDVVVVSIFVNPMQFSPHEDFSKYPRPITRDRKLCREEEVDALFEPTVGTIYPQGFQTLITIPTIARRWEGETRPHHFGGVGIVVTKLFEIVRPQIAVFGQKDYQQAALIKRLVLDLNLSVSIDVQPTIREQDGLAMSSRNRYLSPAERRAAIVLYRSLKAGQQAIKEGNTSGTTVMRIMRKIVAQESSVRIEYLAPCDPVSLEPLEQIPRQVVLLGAIKIGAIRLIDNIIVTRSLRS